MTALPTAATTPSWRLGAGGRRASRRGWSRLRLEAILATAAVVLAVWMVVLATTLPATTVTHGWAAAWIGLDCAEALGLACTLWAHLRASTLLIPAALFTGTLLIIDAWLDITLSWQQTGWALSVCLATLVELPLAGILWRTAVRGLRLQSQNPPAAEIDR
jgi:hypothetical protein